MAAAHDPEQSETEPQPESLSHPSYTKKKRPQTPPKPFWEDWFIGLSRKFLEARGGKLLLLAGTDRLDKELMIGQMQGLF
jgi:protein phosphatase methylesterase 1